MTRIHFDQVPEYAPLAQLLKHRPGRKRNGQDRRRRVVVHDVLHELVEQQHVAVDHADVPEPVAESGPAAEVVDAEYLSVQAELAGQLGHVDGRRAEERAHLDDGPGLDSADEVLEDGTSGAPPSDAVLAEEALDVGGREAVVGRGGVEDFVDDGLTDGLGGHGVAAVGGDLEVVELVAKIGQLLD